MVNLNIFRHVLVDCLLKFQQKGNRHVSGRVVNDLQTPSVTIQSYELCSLRHSECLIGEYGLFQNTQELATLLIVSHALERDRKKR
jgi:hypothetical protein